MGRSRNPMNPARVSKRRFELQFIADKFDCTTLYVRYAICEAGTWNRRKVYKQIPITKLQMK